MLYSLLLLYAGGRTDIEGAMPGSKHTHTPPTVAQEFLLPRKLSVLFLFGRFEESPTLTGLFLVLSLRCGAVCVISCPAALSNLATQSLSAKSDNFDLVTM